MRAGELVIADDAGVIHGLVLVVCDDEQAADAARTLEGAADI